jgi:hypothetical protein
MDVLYQNESVRVVPVKYYHELERAVKMIAQSEEKLANSFLSLYPPADLYEGLTLYFKNRGWTIIAEPA